jgi:hypothetical protein
MKKEQEEICMSLIYAATKKTEVYNSMNELFKGLDQKILREFVSANWDSHYKIQVISLANKTYQEKFKIVDGLLRKKENGEIKRIKIHLIKSIESKIPLDVYDKIIGPKLSRRELLRGTEVELVKFSSDRIKLEVKSPSDFYVHNFTIWDLNDRKGISIVI